nr:hypothetical protein [Tanacetum cinerariifolium]
MPEFSSTAFGTIFLFGLEDFMNESKVSEPIVKKPIVETSKAKTSADKPKVERKNFGPPLIEDWISDSEVETESKSKTEKETVKPSFAKIKFVKSKEQVLGKQLSNKAIVKAKTVNGEGQLQALMDGKKVLIIESTIRRELLLEDDEDEAVNEEIDDNLERATTSATSLDVVVPVAQTRVLDLETTKTIQAMEIESLKRRAKKLKRRKWSRTHRLKRFYKVGLSARVECSKNKGLGEEDASKQGRIADIDSNEDIYLVNVHKNKDIFGVNDLDGDEVIVKDEKMLFNVADDLRGEEVKDKGKGKMVEPEIVKKLSKKDQLKLDEELAFKLQAEEEEEERIAKEKAQQIKEVNIA